MKDGEIYGAISSRLNRGISYLNVKVIETEVEADDDDIEEVLELLWQKGLARRINSKEYELVCDIGQLREFIISKENEGKAVAKRGEYDELADKPITLETIQGSGWKLYEKPKKREEHRNQRGPFGHFQRPNRRGRSSLFDLDDDDDDDDEGDEEKRERIKGLLRQTNNYNEEKHTLEPDMRVVFPNSDIPLVLEWKEDEDGDLYLTDCGCLFEYLLSKMTDKESPCTRDMAELLLIDLEKKSAFAREDNKLINYLTAVNDSDRLRVEVNYYSVQYGKYIKSLAWLLDPANSGSDNPKKDLENKIDAFVNGFKENVPPPLLETMNAGGRARAYVRKILLIDPRITKEQAITVANRLKDKLINDHPSTLLIQAINEAITQLNVMADRAYNMQKMDLYASNSMF